MFPFQELFVCHWLRRFIVRKVVGKGNEKSYPGLIKLSGPSFMLFATYFSICFQETKLKKVTFFLWDCRFCHYRANWEGVCRSLAQDC